MRPNHTTLLFFFNLSAFVLASLLGATEAFAQPACYDATLTDADAITMAKADVDDDDDGLIEICNLDGLDHIRHNLAGTSYKDSSSATGVQCGASSDADCEGYELVKDLDFEDNTDAGYDATRIDGAGGAGWPPIGYSTNGFTGAFEGGGYVIKNLYVRVSTGGKWAGLFARISPGGEVRNLGVEGVSVTGSLIAGGLVGVNAGLVNNCHSTGSITATNTIAGGLVGQNSNGDVTNCHSSVEVRAAFGTAGGLLGAQSTGGTISNCYATGNVVMAKADSGGLAGIVSAGTVSNCYATGDISGDGNSRGGLVGYLIGATVTSCYATGAVSGTGNKRGALVGRLTSTATITSSYATGVVSGGGTQVGGLTGDSRGTVTSSYWESSTDVAGDSDKTADQLKSLPVEDAADLFDVWSTNDWDFGKASQYPALRTYKEMPADTQVQGDLIPGQPCPRIECDPHVSIAAGPSPVTEGTTAEFTLTRTGSTAGGLTVAVTVTGGDGFFSAAAPTEVTFVAGEVTKVLSLVTVDDGDDETDGTVTVTITADASNYRGGDASASVVISDNDLPVVSITKTTDATEGAGDLAVSAVFTVTRVGVTTAPLDVKVGLVFSDGFSSSNGTSETTVTISANEASATLEVGVTDNAMDQADGTITVTLVAFTPATYRIGSSMNAEATITDDDPPSIISFVIGEGSITAIDEMAKTITVTVPLGTVLTNVIPVVVTVRSDATFTPSGAQTFVIGGTAVAYTVTDGDTSVTYQVTVEETTAMPPGVPGGFSAAAGIEQVTLSWTPPAELGTGGMLSRYEYRQTQGSTVSDWVAVTPATATTQVVGSLTADVVYGFEVRAVGLGGLLAGDPTTKVEATPLAAPVPTFGKTIPNQTYTANTAITGLELPEATGGTGALTYSLTPALPNGLSFASDTRMVTGTPSAAASAVQYTYTTTDSGNPAKTATLMFTITVNAEGTPTFEAAIEHQTYTKDSAIEALTLPMATGGTGGLTYTLTPALPNGLSFDTDTRMLTGMPDTIASAAEYTYTVTDASSNEASLTFTITVSAAVAGTFGAGGKEVAAVGVYPNPSGDVLHVELPSGGAFYKISVLTLTGQAALGERQVGGGSRTLDVSSLTRGVYVLKVEDGEGALQTFRIIR